MSSEQAQAKALDDSSVLFQQEHAEVAKSGKSLSVYEVNLHTTLGDADASQVNEIVTSGVSGVALARRLIQASLQGIREQAVYSFSGFDTYQEKSQKLIHLWGITRDLTRAGNFRPAGLALLMLNSVADGQTNAFHCNDDGCNKLTAIAFDQQRVALVSASNQPMLVTLPVTCQYPELIQQTLNGADLTQNNEQTPQVHIQTQKLNCDESGSITLQLPPYSFVTLQPDVSN